MATPAEVAWIQQNPDLANSLGLSQDSPNGAVAGFVKGWYDGQPSPPQPDATDAAIFSSTGVYPNAFQNPSNAPALPQQTVNTPTGNVSNPTPQVTMPPLPPVNSPSLGESFANLTGSGTAGDALQAGAQRAIGGGNTNQVQGGAQSGSYSTGATNYQQGFNNQIGQQQTNQQQNTNLAQTGTSNMTGNTNVTGNTATTGTTNTQGVVNTTGQQQISGTSTTAGQQQSQGTSTTQGTQHQVGSSLSRTTGTTENEVVDKYGLGNLFQSASPQATALDASRGQFLTQAMEQGNPYLQQKVEEATRNALSGPAMVGTGQNARDRSAGYAAAKVAQEAYGQQLQAAQMAGGPSASTYLLQAGSPLLGSKSTTDMTTAGQTLSDLVSDSTTRSNNLTSGTSTTTNNQNILNNQSTMSNIAQQMNQNVAQNQNTSTNQSTNTANNTVGSTNTLGNTLSSMMSNYGQQGASATSGQAAGSNIGVVTGQVPQQQVNQGSGCFVCTVFVDRRELAASTVRRAVEAKLKHLKTYETPLMGYMVYGPILARLAAKYSLARRALRPVCRAVLYQEQRLDNPRMAAKVGATFWHAVFTAASWPFGLLGVKYRKGWSAELLNRNNLNFGGRW